MSAWILEGEHTHFGCGVHHGEWGDTRRARCWAADCVSVWAAAPPMGSTHNFRPSHRACAGEPTQNCSARTRLCSPVSWRVPRPTPRAQFNACRAADRGGAVSKFTQDGDDERCLRLHQLPTHEQAEIIRDVLSIRKRMALGPEELERRRARNWLTLCASRPTSARRGTSCAPR